MAEDKQDLVVGTKLIIEKDIEGASRYASQVLDIKGNKIVISGPIEKGVLVPIHSQTKIKISYYVENVGRFMFKGIVKRRGLKKIYLLEIEQITTPAKVQLRDYYRLAVRLKAMKYFEKNEAQILEEACVTQDLSGGGMRLKSNYDHKRGDLIECDLTIDDKVVSVKGKIVRIDETQDKDFKYAFGVKFLEIHHKSQEIIVQYVFEAQRKLRKKGLI